MAHEFKSWKSYKDFEHITKYQTRYVHTPEILEFLEAVFDTCTDRIEIIPKNSTFWRAQLGHGWRPVEQSGEEMGEVKMPYPPERMKPRAECAVEGRANHKGIPCLYLATERETALAEARPWIGSVISVARFGIMRDLKVINCTNHKGSGSNIIYFEEPPSKEREERVWRDIDMAFAEPVNRSDDVADYAPTQIIAEYFKSKGFDGIAYRSSMGGGHNIALFDINVTESIHGSLFKVEAIKFDFKDV